MSLEWFLGKFKSHSAPNPLATKWIRITLVAYLVVALLVVAITVAFVYTPLNKEAVNRQIENLTTIAQGCANALANATDAQVFVDACTHDTDLRLTIIKTDGTVVADSKNDASTMENHVDREEIKAALNGQTGISQRTSATDNQNWLYIALPASYNDSGVILRISEPSSVVSSMTQNAQLASFIIIGLGIVIVVAIAFITFRTTRQPIKRFDQVRSDFVANASHELKTPVAGIRLLSEAIRDAADIDDKKSLNLFIDRLDNEAERLQKLVIDLLDLSRLEEVPAAERSNRTDLHSALVTSYMAHKNQAEAKHLDLILDDQSSPEDNCCADMEPSDASLVFDNLIENAIMYTDEGSITVTLKPHAHDITIQIKDTGIGIPQTDQSRIFERFYRVNKARSRKVGGTGLGLSLVRHAVERSHGTVQVNSTLGKGTEFIVSFPRSKNAH